MTVVIQYPYHQMEVELRLEHRNDGNGNSAGHVRIFEHIGGSWSQIGQDIDEATVKVVIQYPYHQMEVKWLSGVK